MNTASMVYIPPINDPKVGQTALAFAENLKKNPPAGRLIILSDHDYRPMFPENEHTTLAISPTKLESHRLNPACGVSNALFVVAMRTAREKGLSHVLYLESDCRLAKPGWDEVVFKEFFDIQFPLIAAGTLMTWNIFNGGLKWIQPWQKLINETSDFATPVHTYGSFPHDSNDGPRPCNPTIFPNGAGTVLSVDWMWDMFDGFKNMMKIATGEGMDGKAWDWQIGSIARDKFGPDVFKLFAHLQSVASCYGDLALTMNQRLDLLRSGKVMISHQHKGKEQP